MGESPPGIGNSKCRGSDDGQCLIFKETIRRAVWFEHSVQGGGESTGHEIRVMGKEM